MAITQTTETKTEINPVLKAALKKEFRTYAKLAAEEAAATKKLNQSKQRIMDLREEIGDKSVSIDGFTITLVDGQTTKSFDRVKALAMGITEAQIAEMFPEKPKKSHELVTVPRVSK